MINFRFNLDVTYVDVESAIKAKEIIKNGKKVPTALFNKNETTIYLSASYNRKYFKISTGVKIKPEYYDVKAQKVRLKGTEAIHVQMVLDKIKSHCNSSYRDMLISGKSMSAYEIQRIMKSSVLYDDMIKNDKVDGFFEIYNQFFAWKSKTVNERTMPRYKVLKKQLEMFETSRKTRLSIHEIDKRFGEEFSLFLIDNLKITNNTIAKYLKSLKCFLNYCIENELTKNTKYKQIKSTEESTSIFVLQEHEIQTILDLKIDNRSLKEARDVFCFLCFTGQRYSDVRDLKWKDIVKIGEHYFWRLYQFKTKSTNFIDVPLLPEALKNIHNRIDKKRNEDLIFNVISNQKMNAQLKLIGRLAKLDGQFTTKRMQGNKIQEIIVDRSNKLSTHTGRKSFITIALKKGVPITVVQKVSGHSSIKSMRSYIELSETYVAETLFECFKD